MSYQDNNLGCFFLRLSIHFFCHYKYPSKNHVVYACVYGSLVFQFYFLIFKYFKIGIVRNVKLLNAFIISVAFYSCYKVVSIIYSYTIQFKVKISPVINDYGIFRIAKVITPRLSLNFASEYVNNIRQQCFFI